MSILRYALDQALYQTNLVILKQPIVKLSPNTSQIIIKHYEVLSSVRNQLNTLYNIPNLEALLHELELYKGTRYLDELVFKEVLRWMIERQESNVPNTPLYHINVHPDTINYSSKHLVKRVQEAMTMAGILHGQLCFEITENTFLKDVEKVQATIAELRAMGCKVALDDFGKKMLNLSTLKVLRPDFVKIDGSYVLNCRDSKFDRAAIKAIVELSNIVGAETIAEHVETQTDYDNMKQLGVDYGQGWFFARPVELRSCIHDPVFTDPVFTEGLM